MKIRLGNKLSIGLVLVLFALTTVSAVPAASDPPNRFNPPQFGNSSAPVSGIVWFYLQYLQNQRFTVPPGGLLSANFSSASTLDTAGPVKIRSNNLDAQPIAQNEESVAISPKNAKIVVTGYNDFRGIFTGDFSGFSISKNGGSAVRTDGQLPALTLPLLETTAGSEGDPSIDVNNGGTFYYASLYFNFRACGLNCGESAVVVWRSVPSSSLSTCLGTACWLSSKIVADDTLNFNTPSGFFNDKEWVAVDRSGLSTADSVYVTWTRFDLAASQSKINMVRCMSDLSNCSSPIVISGVDLSTQGSFVAVRTDGSIAVSWVDMDAFPFTIHAIQCTPGADVTFSCGSVSTVATINNFFFLQSYESFRTPTLPQMAVDFSAAHPNRVIVVWNECAPGQNVLGFACDQPVVNGAFTDDSTMEGPWTTFTVNDPTGVSAPASGFFPSVAIDPTDGTVNVGYYSQERDTPWRHRLDVFIAQYSLGEFPGTPTTTRITAKVSEPDDDPLLGGLFFGDYIQVAARGNVAVIAFTANYLLKGTPPTFNQDNFVAKLPD